MCAGTIFSILGPCSGCLNILVFRCQGLSGLMHIVGCKCYVVLPAGFSLILSSRFPQPLFLFPTLFHCSSPHHVIPLTRVISFLFPVFRGSPFPCLSLLPSFLLMLHYSAFLCYSFPPHHIILSALTVKLQCSSSCDFLPSLFIIISRLVTLHPSVTENRYVTVDGRGV